MYCAGSTDALTERIAAHRKRTGGTRVADPLAEFTYVALPQGGGGSSAAKAVEAAVIKAMQSEGYSLLSVVDARKRHAPTNARSVARQDRYT